MPKIRQTRCNRLYRQSRDDGVDKIKNLGTGNLKQQQQQQSIVLQFPGVTVICYRAGYVAKMQHFGVWNSFMVRLITIWYHPYVESVSAV